MFVEHIRAALLDNLPGYMSYATKISITEWIEPDEKNPFLQVFAELGCTKKDTKLIQKKIQAATFEPRLQRLFGNIVKLRLFLKEDGKTVGEL